MFLNANNPKNPGIEMYRGLPLQFVADADVAEIARQNLGAKTAKLNRYIFNGLFEYLAEYVTDQKTCLVNLKNRELLQGDKILPAGVNNAAVEIPRPEKTPERLNKPLSLEPPFEVEINGVPDYQAEYSKGCAPAAGGCVLGYWDAHGYPNLIEGTKSTRGQRDPDGYGYLHMIWEKIPEGTGNRRKNTNDPNQAQHFFPNNAR